MLKDPTLNHSPCLSLTRGIIEILGIQSFSYLNFYRLAQLFIQLKLFSTLFALQKCQFNKEFKSIACLNLGFCVRIKQLGFVTDNLHTHSHVL